MTPGLASKEQSKGPKSISIFSNILQAKLYLLDHKAQVASWFLWNTVPVAGIFTVLSLAQNWHLLGYFVSGSEILIQMG